MEKKMNYVWLFLLIITLIALAVMFWVFTGPTTGSYSGGILIEMPQLPAGQQWAVTEACAAAEQCEAVAEACAAAEQCETVAEACVAAEQCEAVAEACAAGDWR